jgi:asparagine synthase (glutamine-hydrolysing)
MPGILISPSKKELFTKMTNSLIHEKWHQVDSYIDENFGIARIHLGIFNPEPQPIFSEDKSLCIFMDGKIYDYEEEREELKKKGYNFKRNNDAEFCLYSYQEYGTDFIPKLNGNFLFVIYEVKKNKLVIVNDRYGLRQHFYTIHEGKLLLAPECKAILQDTSYQKKLDDDAVSDWFAYGKIFGNKSFFKGIEVLPPASIAIWNGRLSIKQYWDFKYKPDYEKSIDEFVNELITAFKKAVNIRMQDNYRYGISLSGGLDSRAVVSVINKKIRKYVTAYTFGPPDCNEVVIARDVSKAANINFKSISIDPEMIINNAEKEIYLSEGLDDLGVSFLLPTYEAIRENTDVLFDGYAFDLLLGGSFITKSILKAKNENELFRILSQKRLFSDEEFQQLFTKNFYQKIKNYPNESINLAFSKIVPGHFVNMSDYLGLQNHVRRYTLMGDVLARNYLEFLHPTFDNGLVDIILTIPPELRYNHRIYRKFFKKMAPDLAKIPYDKTMIKPSTLLILWKIGSYYQISLELAKKLLWRLSNRRLILFNKRSYVNFEEWFRTNEKWISFFENLLLDKNTEYQKYINKDFVKSILINLRAGKGIRYIRNPKRILFLASFELFLRKFNKLSEKHE